MTLVSVCDFFQLPLKNQSAMLERKRFNTKKRNFHIRAMRLKDSPVKVELENGILFVTSRHCCSHLSQRSGSCLLDYIMNSEIHFHLFTKYVKLNKMLFQKDVIEKNDD